MKHCITFLILILVLAGCHNPRKLEITDLKFADFEKEATARNKVGTMFLISGDYTLNLGESDTFGRYGYDSLGNMLSEEKRMLWGHSVTYFYDSTGLLKHKDYMTDFNAPFGATYRFIADSQVLYQYWAGADTDTCVFWFNNVGRLIESDEYTNDDHGRGAHYKMSYEYDTYGKLVKSHRTLFSGRRDFIFDGQRESTTCCFYSLNKLDSTVTVITPVSDAPKDQEIITTFYNNNGLRDSMVVTGVKINAEIKNPMTVKTQRLEGREAMGILVTRYAYKFRGQ